MDPVIQINDEGPATPMMVIFSSLGHNDCYTCTSCPCSIEILSINDIQNILTFKCLNPNERRNHKIQTIPISEYINSMKKYTYIYSKCCICQKLQNSSNDVPIFSYCIKCDKIICNDCINEHLQLNEENHPNMSKEYIIKNNEKGIRCFKHPKEKNTAFCFECNTHLCNKCLESGKHIKHLKDSLLEVKPNKKIKEKLDAIIILYKEKIKKENEEKEKKELELYLELKKENEKIANEIQSKIKKKKVEIKNKIYQNDKLLSDDLNKLKMIYESDIKLITKKHNFITDSLNKQYKQYEEFCKFKAKQQLEDAQKKYNETLNSLEYSQKIKDNENLLLINDIVKKTQENYEDNYYNNCNINNIVYNYYKSKDPSIKKLLDNE